jgi:excisionase family DNA binding protein
MSLEEDVQALCASIDGMRGDLLRETSEIKAMIAGSGGKSNLTIRETAEYACVAEKTVARWIKARRLPARQAGRRKIVARADLDRFLAEGSDDNAAERPVDEIAADILSGHRGARAGKR